MTTVTSTILFAPAHVFIDEQREGSEYNLPFRLAERLVRDHGFEVILIVGQVHTGSRRDGLRYLCLDGERPIQASNVARLFFHLRVYAAVRRVLTEQRIDLIHHVLPFGFRTTFNLYALLRRRSQPPLVIGPLQTPLSYEGGDEAGIAVRDFSSTLSTTVPLRRRPSIAALGLSVLLSTLSAQTLRRSQACVTLLPQGKRLFTAFAGRIPTVIPWGVDTEEFSPLAPTTNGEQRPLRVIGVGYLVRRKAFDTLVRAVALAQLQGIAVHARIIGDGPERQRLERLARELGVQESVEFAGLVPHNNIVQEYQQADLFCSLALSESFSIVGLEAMACGLPLVATPTGFFREVLQHEAVGIAVRFGDVEELARALLRCARDPALRQAMGEHARECVVRDYDWGVVAAQYASLYRSLMRVGRR